MKISNSKQELARIISENGGWREGEFAAQDGYDTFSVWFFAAKPVRALVAWATDSDICQREIDDVAKIPNWHQTVLSRAEYFHLYPAPDADGCIKRDENGIISIEYNKDNQEVVAPGELDANGWIEWNGGECPVDVGSVVDVRQGNGLTYKARAANFHWNLITGSSCVVAYRLHKPEQSLGELCGEAKEENKHEHIDAKPTIEQLAGDYRNAKDYAERKQQEADDAKADADEALRKLELAGEGIGLIVTPIAAKKEPELVITDWRDLQIGDEVEYISGTLCGLSGEPGVVSDIDLSQDCGVYRIRVALQNGCSPWCDEWRFTRRP